MAWTRVLVDRVRFRAAAWSAPVIRAGRLAAWRSTPSVPGVVVVAGDSIAADFPVELLTPIAAPLAMRGLPGETIRGLEERIAETLDATPQQLVLQVGTNDVFDRTSAAQIVSDYEALLARCLAVLPASSVVVLAIPPVLKAAAGAEALAIRAVNAALGLLAHRLGVRFVDTYGALATPTGVPEPGMMLDDGVHLSGAAYARVAELLRPLLPTLTATSMPSRSGT